MKTNYFKIGSLSAVASKYWNETELKSLVFAPAGFDRKIIMPIVALNPSDVKWNVEMGYITINRKPPEFYIIDKDTKLYEVIQCDRHPDHWYNPDNPEFDYCEMCRSEATAG